MSYECDCGTTGCDPCTCGHPWSDHDSNRDRVCYGEWCECRGFDALLKPYAKYPPAEL